MPLQAGEVGLVYVLRTARARESVHHQAFKDLEDLLGSRSLAQATLRVDRQGPQSAALHRLTNLALDEGVDQESEEINAQERLDPRHALEVLRGHFMGRLEVVMTLLHPGLAELVCLESLLRRELAIAGHQREDPVGPLIVEEGV